MPVPAPSTRRGHRAQLVGGPVILAGDCVYWQEHLDDERVPGVVFNPTLAFHSIRRLKTLARLVKGRVFPSHDPVFWQTVRPTVDGYH